MHLDTATLAKIRLAVSPAVEATEWLRLAANGRRHPVFGDPGAAARFALRDPDVALLGRLLTRKTPYTPDLFTPKPLAGTTQHAWRGQLDLIVKVRDAGFPTADRILRQLEAPVFRDAAAQTRAACDDLQAAVAGAGSDVDLVCDGRPS